MVRQLSPTDKLFSFAIMRNFRRNQPGARALFIIQPWGRGHHDARCCTTNREDWAKLRHDSMYSLPGGGGVEAQGWMGDPGLW